MKRFNKLFILIAALFLFPITPKTALIETELTYKPMSAKGFYSFVPYLGGVGQINLVNGNLVFSRQLVGRVGRAGFALDLSIFYNSQIWKRTGNTQMGIAEPGSRVGLGWRLSLPYLVQGSTSYALVMPDGSSHEIQDYGSGAWKSVDSTYILLNPSSSPPEATLKGGTKLIFGNTIGSISYATEMRDRNGNQIFATYVAGTGSLDTITDTQGTVAARFYYNADGTVDHIHSSGTVHGDIKFNYTDTNNYSTFPFGFVPSFPSPFSVQLPGPSERILVGIAIWPGDGSKQLAQAFTYNTFGELSGVTNYVVEYGYDEGQWVALGVSYRAVANFSYVTKMIHDKETIDPKFIPQRMVSQKYEYVYDSQNNLNTTTWNLNYDVDGTKSNPSTVTVSSTDGMSVYALNYTTSGNNWSDGLVQASQRKTPNGQTTLQTASNLWTQDDVNKAFILNPRITKLTTTLDNGMSTEVDTTYTDDGTGNVRDVIQKGFSGAILKKTTTAYWHETHSDYASKNLTNLISSVSTKDASDNELARTETVYDDYASVYPLADCPYIVSHSSSYGTGYTMRGNPAKVSQRYIEQGRMIDSYMKYDIAGNVLRTKDPKGNETSTVYEPYFYGLPQSTTNTLNQTSYTSWAGYSESDTLPPYYHYVFTGGLSGKMDANGAWNPGFTHYDWLNRKSDESAPAIDSGVQYFYSAYPVDSTHPNI